MSIASLVELYTRLHSGPSWTFDKTPTPAILAFEAVILLGAIAALVVLPRFTDRVPARFALTAGAIFIFEFFTSPMWTNHKLGPWAYVFQDVSWVLTLGWATVILSVVVFVDHFLARWSERRRFLVVLAALTAAICVLEAVVVNLGIRGYSPEVRATVAGAWVLGVPLEILYYVPVFMALVVGFLKYWSFALEGRALVPMRRLPWLRTLAISLLSVFCFELMIEPMVHNVGFPAWSYVYRDLTLVLTLLWVVDVWLAQNLAEALFARRGLAARFAATVAAAGVIALPVETWLIQSGHRVYGPSAVGNLSGFHLPGTAVPLEVAFAIPLYLSLVIGLARYLELTAANRF